MSNRTDVRRWFVRCVRRNRVARLLVAAAITAAAQTGRAACPDFGTAVDFAAGSIPNSIVIADMNRDGKPDLVVANTEGTVSVLLGDGYGGFTRTPSNTSVGGSADSLVVADFDKDGKLDVAVTVP